MGLEPSWEGKAEAPHWLPWLSPKPRGCRGRIRALRVCRGQDGVPQSCPLLTAAGTGTGGCLRGQTLPRQRVRGTRPAFTAGKGAFAGDFPAVRAQSGVKPAAERIPPASSPGKALSELRFSGAHAAPGGKAAAGHQRGDSEGTVGEPGRGRGAGSGEGLGC